MRAYHILVALLPNVSACGHLDFNRAVDASIEGSVDSGDGSVDTLSGDLLLHLAFDSSELGYDSATGLTATCSSCPVPVNGPRGTPAAQFNGNECLRLPAQAPPQQFTFAAWVWLDLSQTATLFGRTLNAATTDQNSFKLLANTADELEIRVGTRQLASPTISVMEWHHVAGTYDGGMVLGLYFDGALYGIANGPVTALYGMGDDFTFGCDVDVNLETFVFDGSLDEVRLYGRVLSTPEIVALAQ